MQSGQTYQGKPRPAHSRIPEEHRLLCHGIYEAYRLIEYPLEDLACQRNHIIVSPDSDIDSVVITMLSPNTYAEHVAIDLLAVC